MTEPFLGQLLLTSFDFPPKGYAACNGALLQINQNQALFALLGTRYGGNGQSTFGLPDLRGRVPVHIGAGIVQGEAGGSTTVTLNQGQMPAHAHTVRARAEAGSEQTAAGNVLATSGSAMYGTGEALAQMNAGMVGPAGSTQPHPNMQPYTVIGCCIAIQGIFPSPN